MKTVRLLALSLFLLLVTAALAQKGPIVIRAGTLLDGQGHMLHDVEIVVENGKILHLEKDLKGQGKPTYDLSRLTVMPGWIDVHDHVTWHFGPNGHFDDKSETPDQAALAAAANAY